MSRAAFETGILNADEAGNSGRTSWTTAAVLVSHIDEVRGFAPRMRLPVANSVAFVDVGSTAAAVLGRLRFHYPRSERVNEPTKKRRFDFGAKDPNIKRRFCVR